MIFRRKKKYDKISIGITTFGKRFDQYFVPLLSKIRDYDNVTEVIVAVNGEHKKDFDEDYRHRILDFMSKKKGVYTIMFPGFRGLSKLWNTIIIHATHDNILVLNDDIMITKRSFLDKIKKALHHNEGKSFIINGSWSHFVVNREEIDKLGYFDERLLGIGEEDGDITWRYIHEFGRPVNNYSIKAFKNFAEETLHIKPTNIKCHSDTKYSLFNRRFIQNHKYRADPQGIKGIFPQTVSMKSPGPVQYQNERFFRTRKDEL
jgi:hypothetical protein